MNELDILIREIDNIIYSEGIDYLRSHHFDVEKKLLSIEGLDISIVKMFIYSLDFDIKDKINGHRDDRDYIISIISELTSLYRDKCSPLGDIYLHIYGYKSLMKRNELEECGLKEFYMKAHKFSWSNTDSYGDDYFSVYYIGKMKGHYQVTDIDKVKQHIKKQLEENPFFSNKRIECIFNEVIKDIADEEFTHYIHSDDYYEPCIDDLAGEFADRINYELEKYGIEIYGEEVDMKEER